MDSSSPLGNEHALLPTMIVGSLPRPAWLAEPKDTRVYTERRLRGEALREAEDDAVAIALRDQEEAGLDVVTDGEQRRRHYIWGFCEGLEGIDFENLVKKETRGGRYQVKIDVARVVAPIRRPRSILVDALRHAKSLTAKPIKVTLPGPMTTTDTLADEHYGGDRRRLASEIAKVLNDEAIELAENGAAIVQFDEPCFNIYLDEVEDWGVRTLEAAARGVSAKTAVHVCYGYGIPVVLAWKTTNTDWSHYARSLPLLRTSTIDLISVECAASGVDPTVLGLARGKDIAVGVIDVGTDEVETPATVAARIRPRARPRRAGASLPVDRLRARAAHPGRVARQDASTRRRGAAREERDRRLTRHQRGGREIASRPSATTLLAALSTKTVT